MGGTTRNDDRGEDWSKFAGCETDEVLDGRRLKGVKTSMTGWEVDSCYGE